LISVTAEAGIVPKSAYAELPVAFSVTITALILATRAAGSVAPVLTAAVSTLVAPTIVVVNVIASDTLERRPF